MRLASLVIASIVAIALAFVPAVPLTHFGDTSWLPVWWVYPYTIAYLHDASSYYRELAWCFGFIVAHLGLSLAVGATVGMVVRGLKNEMDDDMA